jgi:hypothetical protein
MLSAQRLFGRLWRIPKYEEICLKEYHTMVEPKAGLDRYFRF